MSVKRLSSVDTAWLRMEEPNDMMMITALLIFDTPIDFKRLRGTIEHRLLRFDRFRQRVLQPSVPWGSYCWEDDPRFDINAHLRRIVLPPPGDERMLRAVVSELMSTQLDFSRPLWQYHVIERYGKGSAIIVRLHHCIADGVALIHILLSLTDKEPDAPWHAAGPKKPARLSSQGVAGSARSVLQTTTQWTERLMDEGREIFAHPERAINLAELGAEGVAALGRLVFRWPDPQTLFKGPLGIPKRAAWSGPISLQDVKEIGHTMGGTVNDVLLTAVTGALRTYMESRDAPVDGVNIRAIVPVNLRPLDADPSLGNKFSLVFLSLPVGIARPLDRLRELKRRMDELKGSAEAAVAFGILNTIGMVPQQIQDIIVDIFGTKGTAVMTNVPGPKEKLYMAGAPLSTVMFWVPQSGHLGLGVSIISYAGQVWLGVATDQGLVPDPEKIIDAFHAEFRELCRWVKRKEARRAKTVKPLIGMLDEALGKLDGAQVKSLAAGPSGKNGHKATRGSKVAGPNGKNGRQVTREAKAASPSGRNGHNSQGGKPELCKATTQTGHPCRNHALPGSTFCRLHQKKEQPAETDVRISVQ